MPIFDDPGQLGAGPDYYEDDANSGAGDLIWGSTPAMTPWQYGKYIKIDVPNWNNSTGTDPMGGVDPPLRSYLRLGSIEAPPFAQPPSFKKGKAATATAGATPSTWSAYKYKDGAGVAFPTPGKGPTPATPTWKNDGQGGHYVNTWSGNLDPTDSQTAAQSSIVGLVWGAGGYNLPNNQVLNPDFSDEWGTGNFTFASNIPSSSLQANPWGGFASPWASATGTFTPGGASTNFNPNGDQLIGGNAFTGQGGSYTVDPGYYGTAAVQNQIAGGLQFSMYQFAATALANANYTGATTIKSTGPAFYQQLVANAPDSTGEDLASLVKGFADDSRIRTVPQSPTLTPPTGKGFTNSTLTTNGLGYTGLPTTWGPWGDLLGAQNTASRSTLVGPAIGYPQMSSLYVQAAPNWFDNSVEFGARQTVGPTDPADPTAWTPLPGYYKDFAGPGYVNDADYRAIESYYLHTKGGWRDHTDGNRITTTRGDKVEVIRGNYKLIVLGRQDQAKSATAGMDISGGQTDTSPGGLAATSTTDPSTLTAIFELKQGPDRQYRSWSTTKKGTGTVKLGADGVTVTVPSQGVTYGETWGWKTYALTGVETQPILSGGSGPPVGMAGWRPWGQGVGGFAPQPISGGVTGNPTGLPLNPAFPTTYPTDATTLAKTGEVVPNLASLTAGGWDGDSPGAGIDGPSAHAYQIRTGGINPTTVGLLWPAFQNLTETHVVQQAGITAVDTQVTLAMGQIPTMAILPPVGGTLPPGATNLLDPIATALGYGLTMTPPIGSPSLPTDIGGDPTQGAGAPIGTAGGQQGQPGSDGGNPAAGNKIVLGQQQGASPFFNYAGIPLQQTSGGAMQYPATGSTAAPWAPTYKNIGIIGEDPLRQSGPVTISVGGSSGQNVPLFGTTYPSVLEPPTPSSQPTTYNAPVSQFPTAAAFVGQENLLSDFRPYGPGYLFWPDPQVHNADGSYTVQVTLPIKADFVVPPPVPAATSGQPAPYATSGAGLNATIRLANQLPKIRNSSTESHAMLSRAWSFVDTSFSHTEVTGFTNDSPTQGDSAHFSPSTRFPSGDMVALGAYPGVGKNTTETAYQWNAANQMATFMPLPGDTPGGVGIAAGYAGQAAGFFLATLDFPTVFSSASPANASTLFGADQLPVQPALTLAQLSGDKNFGPAATAPGGQGQPAVQLVESIVIGNSVAHSEVNGWQHTMSHVVDNTTQTIVDNVQHSVTAAHANYTEGYYNTQIVNNYVQTQTTTNNITTQTTTNNVGSQTTNNNISGTSNTISNIGTQSSSLNAGATTSTSIVGSVTGFTFNMVNATCSIMGMLKLTATVTAGIDLSISATLFHFGLSMGVFKYDYALYPVGAAISEDSQNKIALTQTEIGILHTHIVGGKIVL